jgi:tetratricopeptide (TPR) repeat protein
LFLDRFLTAFRQAMRRHILTVLLLAAGVAAVLAATRVQREQDYQRLVLEGDRALSSGDLAAAVEAFTGALTLRPDSMLAYLRRGEAYRRRGADDLSSALRDLRTAASLDPTAPGPHEGLGDVAMARDNPIRAVGHYQASVNLDERSARVQYKHALALYKTGQITPALEALAMAGPLDPRIASVPYLRGLCLIEAGRPQEAHAALVHALNVDPGMTAARETLADLSRTLGRLTDEQSHLTALMRAEPDRPERQLALGRAYARAGRTDLAITTLSNAATRFPSESSVYLALASVWLGQAVSQGDRIALQKGLEALRQAGPAGASDSTLLTLTGAAWLRVREPRRALRAFEQATAVLPLDLTAHDRLADTAERLGMWTVARDALRQAHALANEPAGAPAARARLIRLGDLSMKIGDPRAAREWFLRARSTGADAALAVRLAAAERAIDTERPLEDEGTPVTAASVTGTSVTAPSRKPD